MTDLFIRIIEISVGASFLMLVVFFLRALLSKSPKWIPCLLWGLVALRLIMPVRIESDFSLMPRLTWRSGIGAERNQEVAQKQGATDQEFIPTTYKLPPQNETRELANAAQSGDPGEMEAKMEGDVSFIASWIWMAGTWGMLGYALISWRRIRRMVRGAVLTGNGIYECQEIGDAFVLGIIKPKIYLPSGLPVAERNCVLCHERAHVARGDQAWRLLGFTLLTMYWFHPLVWISYRLFCRDVEMACDERATYHMKPREKADYCQVLLNLSSGRKVSYAGPLSFGARDARSRIHRVLHHKRPSFWVTAVSFALSVTLCLCFMTSPRSRAEDLLSFPENDIGQKEARGILDGITPSKSAISDEIIELDVAAVLLRDFPLYYVRDGVEIPVSIKDLPSLLGRAEDPDFRFWCFSVADLDGDGAPEVVLQGYGAKGDYVGRVILHGMGDRIYVYEAGRQSTWIIYENGSYHYSDWATMEEGFAKITGFSKSDFVEEKYQEAEALENSRNRACSYVFSEENLSYVWKAFQPN